MARTHCRIHILRTGRSIDLCNHHQNLYLADGTNEYAAFVTDHSEDLLKQQTLSDEKTTEEEQSSIAVFLNLYSIMPHYNTSTFLSTPRILNYKCRRKYQDFEKNCVFIDHLEIIDFCPYFRKYPYSRKRFLDFFEKMGF